MHITGQHLAMQTLIPSRVDSEGLENVFDDDMHHLVWCSEVGRLHRLEYRLKIIERTMARQLKRTYIIIKQEWKRSDQD